MVLKNEARGRNIRVSFEFFPPKSEEMEGQLWHTVSQLQDWDPDFVSVTYGAERHHQSADADHRHAVPVADAACHRLASHLCRCDQGRDASGGRHVPQSHVTHFVALRGDAPGGA